MRILCVEPGPNFAVADVHEGWAKALAGLGNEVRVFNLAARLQWVEAELRGKLPENERGQTAARWVAEQLRGACFDLWPDLVVICSAFFIPPETYDIIRSRGIKVVVLLTESPYEDSAQYNIAARADLALVNDPTNLDTFRQHQPNTFYLPHAYDPDRHHRRPLSPDLKCDFGWVGTAFPSRIGFFEQVDWRGADVALAGNWQALEEHSPLAGYLVHEREACFHNNDTVDLYSSCKASANLYRREGAAGISEPGWSVGPREVELAACGTFFLRDPRPEGDDLFPMLPTFTGPDEFSDKLAWWLTHDTARDTAADAAREQIAEWTFTNRAKFLLSQIS
jgi:spore maturation protein CgeB